MRKVESFALGIQKPQDVVSAAYEVIQPFGKDEVSTPTGLLALGLSLQVACDATGLDISDVLQVVRNMLNEAGSTLRTDNTEHVRAFKLFIEGEL